MSIDVGALPDAPALARARRGERTVLCLWRDGRLAALDLDLDALLAEPLADARRRIERAAGEALDPAAWTLLPPVGGQEVWAAGVTYRRSREARLEESLQKDVYARVYEAERPELFFKAPGWRVVGPGDPVAVRSDSTWSVPEPELAVLSNRRGELFAYACGNDMSSRSIEGENPLYLPQAKIYERSCALGPAAALAWEADPARAEISMEIARRGRVVFAGRTSAAEMVRRPADLVAALHGGLSFPVGVWLLTGTGIVPDPDYTAQPGDEVTIWIEGLGTLRNPVDLLPVGTRA
jgi:2-dehydro-3-deoxy-D-arabinonate dehydratase